MDRFVTSPAKKLQMAAITLFLNLHSHRPQQVQIRLVLTSIAKLMAN
jgi:hypothetical protein